MMKFLRKNTKIIIWAVVFSFILWGGYSVGTSFKKEGRVAGEIFGKDISFQEFNSFYRASQIFSITGKTIEDPNILKQHTWQSLILSQEAKRQKIDVSDDEVLAEVFRLLAVQKIENPSPELYRRWVQATLRETPQEFESQIREILRIQKLIQNINQEPLADPPTEEEARQEFLRDEAMITAELMLFVDQNKAQEFYQKVSNASDWKKETEDKQDQVRALTKISLDSLINLWQVEEQKAFELHAHEEGSIIGPLPVGGKYGVFYLKEKKDADEEKFQTEAKEQYLNQLINQMKYQRYVQWAMNLQERANLKDYMPSSELPPSDETTTDKEEETQESTPV
ncbi:MAG: SurA N-terminal domain-containing protein [Candidatus Omnitrophica bacterium]|nr:SurA N-terminal domain-containing protein [Candidatus Omnitrophota bacterium]